MTRASLSQVSFLVPVRNDAVRLARCLDSIARASVNVGHEVLVIDHRSTDDSAAVAEARGARVLSIDAANVAALRNAGAGRAAAPLLAFVDADHELAPDWTTAALDALADPAVAAAGALYHAPAGGTWVQQTYDLLRRHASRVEPAEWFGAGNLVIRKTVFLELGGFDTTLESCEDVDLCFRLVAGGHRMLAVPGLHSTHHGDPPTLGRLFVAEIWRGRDNLRVSLRGPLSVGNVVSTALPLVLLAATLGTIAGAMYTLATGSPTALLVTAVAAAAAAAVVMLRVMTMSRRMRRVTFRGLLRVFAVAAVYEGARAAALVVRASHHRRHTAVPARA